MKNLSIKQKIAFSLIASVLIAAALVASINLLRVSSSVEQRVLEKELPNVVQRIAVEIDKEISQMQTIARQIATDPMILDWNQRGQSVEGERLLVAKLKQIATQNGLSAASFADRQSAKYWNQDGFLRTLQDDNRDGWFYAYKRSGLADMVSTYRYPDGKTDLFVNYQQVSGRGLSGTAKSFESVITFLQSFTLEQSGFVFLADSQGVIQIHNDTNLLGTATLASQFGNAAASALLQQSTFAVSEASLDGQDWIVAASYIPSMQWYVVAQVPRSEVFAGVSRMVWESVIWTLLATAVTALLGWYLAGTLTRPLHRQARMFKRLGMGEADLNYRLPEEGEREVVAMARGYNAFAAKLQQVFDSISAEAAQLRGLATELRRQAEQSMHSSHETDTNTTHMSAAMAQINAAVSEIASNASHATNTAREVEDNRAQIAGVVARSRQDIHGLSNKIDDVAQVIETLNNNTQTIAGVLEVIQSISDQTNLLALNAAIEAARAGEQGRGFSVVADEVRSLAGKTAESTKEIQQIIEQLRQSAGSVTDEINQIVLGSRQTSESIQQAEEILASNKQRFAEILDITNQIAVATEQQSVSIREINQNMHKISEHSGQNMHTISDMAKHTLQMTELAAKVDSQLDQFRR
ncbi:methyl-accepting chemotaxis protein [Bowmanella sp. JS7-9]|uniref:methyl-accepting chemotaxis protein n=1 Tax=Alteromonadaceae TaxID=72275 RepID=UPI0010D63759|nr:methyl-accepting chemotaxis protein [Bowmanella sp. JS7-9]TBX23633.1 chemotaxis protein [Bowmanella sp. JS7-9]